MATYKGRSQAIHVGGSGAANEDLGGHGWRLSVPGTQTVGAGATAVVTFSTDALVDTDHYWHSGQADQVSIPVALGGLYVFGADAFDPAHDKDLLFELVVLSGDFEAPALYGTAGSLIHTAPPKSENAMAGFYKLQGGAVIQLKVTNNTGGSVTLEQGSFSGVLLIPFRANLNCDASPTPVFLQVKHAIVHGAGSITVTLDNPPQKGSALVACLVTSDQTDDASNWPDGWWTSIVSRQTSNVAMAFNELRVISVGEEGASQSLTVELTGGGPAAASLILAEYSGLISPWTPSVGHTDDDILHAVWPPGSGGLTPPAGVPTLMIGVVADPSGNNLIPPEMTIRDNFSYASSTATAHVWFADRIEASADPPYNYTVTNTGGGLGTGDPFTQYVLLHAALVCDTRKRLLQRTRS